MPFTLQDYLKTGFSNVKKTPEEIRAAAEAILANKEFWGAIGQSAPVNWAGSALAQIKDYEEAQKIIASEKESGANTQRREKQAAVKLDRAFSWITGASQPTLKARVLQKASDAKADIQRKIANEASNAANVLDIPDASSAGERAKLEKRAKEIQADMNRWVEIGKNLGVDTAKAEEVVRSAAGFIPRSEQSAPGITGDTANQSRLGQTSTVKPQADGTFAIVGANGLIIEQGFASIDAALKKQQELSGGSSPNVQGAFAPSLENASGVSSPILDQAGINYNGLTQGQITAAEQTYLQAQGDTNLTNKIFQLQDITDADIQDFLKKAASEQDPYYNQIFSRASEDFTRSLQYQTEVRQQQLEQEKLDLQNARENLQIGVAETGTATSGIRKKAEKQLSQQAESIATSSRRQFNFDVTNLGRQAEDILGSTQVKGLELPKLSGTGVYNPLGNVRGSLERERETQKQARADELQREETQRRQEVLAAEGGTTTF
jgi:hypothetical protein